MISVCMATYNGEKYIKEQIDSILMQLDENDELIISDDGSTDNTIEIVKSYNDDRIKIFLFNGHCYTKNFENALKQAQGDYIFLSDQDDVWLPNKVKVSLKYLKKYDFIMCNTKIVDEELNIIEESRNKVMNVKNGFLCNFFKTKYLGCCIAFNKEVLKLSLPFPKNSNLCLHDAWITFLSEWQFKTCVIEEPLMLYRRHSNNVSNGSVIEKINLFKSLKIRIYMMHSLIRRCVYGTNK